MKAKEPLARDMHVAKNITGTFPGFMGRTHMYTHVHTLQALVNKPGSTAGQAMQTSDTSPEPHTQSLTHPKLAIGPSSDRPFLSSCYIWQW